MSSATLDPFEIDPILDAPGDETIGDHTGLQDPNDLELWIMDASAHELPAVLRMQRRGIRGPELLKKTGLTTDQAQKAIADALSDETIAREDLKMEIHDYPTSAPEADS